MSIYDYSVPTPKGEEISLKDYEGKVILIVNTATGCGFTPHYKPIEEMYEQFHDKGFEVIDIPCNSSQARHPERMRRSTSSASSSIRHSSLR